MKKIVRYINESYDTYRLIDLDITYDCFPEKIILEAPETFQESDIQQLLDDMFLNGLPAADTYAEKFFGKNMKNIYDVYFKYEKFTHLTSDSKHYDITFPWDSKYAKDSSTDVKLDYFELKNLTYHISFDKFELLDADDNNINDLIIQIFKAAESNNDNDYAIKIKLNEENIEYRKD